MSGYNCYALLPDGTPVFDAKGNPDLKRGDLYISVSQILAMESAGDFLINWALRTFGGQLDPIKAYRTYMDQVSDLGTRLHSYIEHDLKGIDVDPASLTPDLLPGVESWHAFRSQHKIKVIETERVLFSKKYRFAGTQDIKLYIDDQLYIADLKTGTVLDKAFVQLAAYKYMNKEMKLKNSENAKLLVLGGSDSQSKIANGGKIQMHTLDSWFTGDIKEEHLFAAFMCLRYLWQIKNLESKKFQPAIKGFDKVLEPMIERFLKAFNN